MTSMRLKSYLRALAAGLLAATFAWWLVAGAHRGWTMTSVPKRVLDEITGIEAVVYEKRLVPGVDVLGAAVIVAFLMIGLSCLLRAPRTSGTSTNPK